MKKKIKIRDFEGKVVVLEKTVESKDHLEAQIKYPKKVFKNKK